MQNRNKKPIRRLNKVARYKITVASIGSNSLWLYCKKGNNNIKYG